MCQGMRGAVSYDDEMPSSPEASASRSSDRALRVKQGENRPSVWLEPGAQDW